MAQFAEREGLGFFLRAIHRHCCPFDERVFEPSAPLNTGRRGDPVEGL